jgi:hypothetical protein
MNRSAKLFVGCLLVVVCGAVEAVGQELKKIRHDYHSGGVQYSPDDPWSRSKVFQAHTGHAGFFYNCDSEECKRNSPYIYWKANCQPLWPERIRIFEGIRTDLDKVRWRINAGGCGCEYCLNNQDCKSCQACGSGCKDSRCRLGSNQPNSDQPVIETRWIGKVREDIDSGSANAHRVTRNPTGSTHR